MTGTHMPRRQLLSLATTTLVVATVDWRRAAYAGEQPLQQPSKYDRVDTRVGQNHGHVLPLSLADVQRGVDHTYDLSGSSGHKHIVTFTAAMLNELASGRIVRVPSSRDGGHLHRLYARCVPAVLPADEISACDVVVGGKDDHELIIPESHVRAKIDRSYEIQGIAAHAHPFTLATRHFEALLRGEKLSLRCGPSDGHTHVVFLSYRAKANALPPGPAPGPAPSPTPEPPPPPVEKP